MHNGITSMIFKRRRNISEQADLHDMILIVRAKGDTRLPEVCDFGDKREANGTEPLQVTLKDRKKVEITFHAWRGNSEKEMHGEGTDAKWQENKRA